MQVAQGSCQEKMRRGSNIQTGWIRSAQISIHHFINRWVLRVILRFISDLIKLLKDNAEATIGVFSLFDKEHVALGLIVRIII